MVVWQTVPSCRPWLCIKSQVLRLWKLYCFMRQCIIYPMFGMNVAYIVHFETFLDSSCDYACGYLFIPFLWIIAGGVCYSSLPEIIINIFKFIYFCLFMFSAPGLLSWRLEYCFIRGSKCTSSPRIHLHPSMYVYDTVCVATDALLIVYMYCTRSCWVCVSSLLIKASRVLPKM